jgi:hypothetical protein
MKNFYVYLWLREDNTPYYVGKGSGNRAYIRHRVGRCPEGRVLIRDCFSEKEAFEMEKFLIELYGRKDLGTGCLRNYSSGGIGGSANPSEEVRYKMGAARRGVAPSASTRRKISCANAGRKHPHKSHPVSQETRSKISKYRKGRENSYATRIKMSDAKKGKPWSEARWRAERERLSQ